MAAEQLEFFEAFLIFVFFHSEIQNVKSPLQEHPEVQPCGKPPLLCQQPSLHSMSFSDKERESHLPNGRSISLMDLQNSHLLDAPPKIGRVGSQASIGPLPPPLPHLHHHYPQQQQAKVVTLRENVPQSAPQVRRPLQLSLSQQRSQQPLCFQNPVYQLNNLHALRSAHAPLQAHSSSENLSTASSHSASPSTASRKMLPFTTSLNEGDVPSPCWHTALVDAQPGPQVMAVARQSGTGTAHIVKVEQQSRTNGGVSHSLPHSNSLRSSSSVNTDPQQQSEVSSRQQSICSRDGPILSNRTNRQVCAFILIFTVWQVLDVDI